MGKRKIGQVSTKVYTNDEITVSPDSWKTIVIDQYGKPIIPLTPGQEDVIDGAKKNKLVVVAGPAGTGKTMLAVAYASRLLKNDEIDKIIITRSPVETGRSIGFLKGDMMEKYLPYLVPMIGCFEKIFGKEEFDELLREHKISASPIGLMRGDTFENCCVILDEAQNCTYDELKMFCTRQGRNCHVFMLGDDTQSDLRRIEKSAFSIVCGFLGRIRDSIYVELGIEDVVRDDIVRDFIIEFQRYEESAN